MSRVFVKTYMQDNGSFICIINNTITYLVPHLYCSFFCIYIVHLKNEDYVYLKNEHCTIEFSSEKMINLVLDKRWVKFSGQYIYI